MGDSRCFSLMIAYIPEGNTVLDCPTGVATEDLEGINVKCYTSVHVFPMGEVNDRNCMTV